MLKMITAGMTATLVMVPAAFGQTVSIGTGGQGSMQYSIGAGIAKVAGEDHGLKATIVPQGGPVVTIPMTNAGEFQFSLGVGLVAVYAHKGAAMFKGRPQNNLRLAATLFANRLGFYVRKDSKIMSLEQVKGKRLGTRFTKQKIVGLFSRSILAMAGLSLSDVSGVPVPSGVRQVDEFMAGNIDVVMWSLNSGKTRQAHAAVGGIRVLSLPNTPEAVAAMQKITPGTLVESLNPSPLFPGITEPTNILASPFVLVTSTKTPEKTVYDVVKSIYGGKERLMTVHKAFGGLNPSKMHADLGVPYHSGASKFYAENGI
jgi:TRAP transporter TAXI family solute receptor